MAMITGGGAYIGIYRDSIESGMYLWLHISKITLLVSLFMFIYTAFSHATSRRT